MRPVYGCLVHFAVLGPLRITGPDGPIEVRGQKERTLLALLVANRDRTVPTSAIMDALWGEEPPASAHKSLQTFVLRVRNVVEPDRARPPKILVTDAGGYRLVVPPASVDADRFAALAVVGRASLDDAEPYAAAVRLRAGLALWRGPAYADFGDCGFGQAEALRLEEIRLSAMEDAWSARLMMNGADVIPEVERQVGDHPYRERSWALLIRGLYLQGRQGDALGAFDRARRVLHADLGVEPGRELRDLHAQVLAQDPALEKASPSGPGVLPPDLVADGPLFGREQEIVRLRSGWSSAVRGDAVTVVIRGPAGAGATRLAQEIAAQASKEGAPVASTRTGGSTSAMLLIADHQRQETAKPGQLVVVLSRDGDTLPPGADVIDLEPLGEDAARQLITASLSSGEFAVDGPNNDLAARQSATEVADDTAALILADVAVWWPRDLVTGVARWLRNAARVQGLEATNVATRSTDELLRARLELTKSVLTLTQPELRDVGAPESAAVPVCPWRGLAAYDVKDAAWFAGRERLVAELLARLASSRMLALVGPSGSGKSSALRAGLLGALETGALPGSASWRTLLFRPGAHPLQELSRSALRQGVSPSSLGDVLEQLVRAESGDANQRIIVAVDQLEEVWTACRDPGERSAFLTALADLAQDADSPVTVVFTIRPDFLARLAEYDRITYPLSDNTVLVGTPTPAEIGRAIERPAARAGLHLQVGLVDAIITDAASEPGLLPLLSTALTRLWDGRTTDVLTLNGYVAAGGLTGAIAGMAERAYLSLGPPDQQAARVLFLRLAGFSEGSDVTRRRVPLSELAALPDPRVSAVVEPLVASRLLTVSSGTVEVAHEALFGRWPRLRGWLAEDVAARAVQHRLAVAAQEWDGQGRDRTQLWRGNRLLSGREILDLHPDLLTVVERDFLDAGQQQVDAERQVAVDRVATAQRQVRRLRWLLTGIVLLLVATMVIGGVAIAAQRRAQAASESADARRLAAQAATEQHLDLGLLSAVEAVKAEPGPQTYGALLSLLTQAPRMVTQIHAHGRFLRTAVSADGSTAYLAENGAMWRGVDAITGEQRFDEPLAGQSGELVADPWGRGVLTVLGGTRSTVQLLDGRTGSVVWSTEVPPPAPGQDGAYGYGGAWLPDGRWIVAGIPGILIGNADTGRIESAIAWPPDFVDFFPDWLRLLPDGRVTMADNNRTAVFDPGMGSVLPFDDTGSVRAVSAAGALAVVEGGGQDRYAVRLRTVDSAAATGSFTVPQTFTYGLAFSPDGSELAVGAGETLQIRDGSTGKLREELAGHSGVIMEVGYAGSDNMLWTAGRDGLAIGWDRSGRRGIFQTNSGAASTWFGSTDAMGTTAAGIAAPQGEYNTVHVFDPGTGELRHPILPIPEECVRCDPTSVAITPDARTVIAGAVHYRERAGVVDYNTDPDLGYLLTWDAVTGANTGMIELSYPPQGLVVTPDGQSLVVNGGRESLLIDLTSKATIWGPEPHPQIPDVEATNTVVISTDGRLIALGVGTGVQLRDLTTGQLLAESSLGTGDLISSITLSADAATVAVGTLGGYLQVLDSSDLQPVVPRRLTVGGFIIDLAASPDGRYLATLGSDGDLLLWDTSSWQPIGRPINDENGWGYLSFDPDGVTLRAVYQNGEVFSFTLDPSAWIQRACTIANRDLTSEEFAIVRPGVQLRPTCDS